MNSPKSPLRPSWPNAWAGRKDMCATSPAGLALAGFWAIVW